MNRSGRLGGAKAALLRQKERLSKFDSVSLAVTLIPFMGVIVLSLYTSLETNTRLHANGKPMEYPAAQTNDHAMWLSVSVKGGKVIVTTSGVENFLWPESGPSDEDLAPLKAYLSERAKKLVNDTVRVGQLTPQNHTAVIAMDHSMTFHHVRPIIYALGNAGFSRYGFETRLLK
jgi:hypothetical protein